MRKPLYIELWRFINRRLEGTGLSDHAREDVTNVILNDAYFGRVRAEFERSCQEEQGLEQVPSSERQAA